MNTSVIIRKWKLFKNWHRKGWGQAQRQCVHVNVVISPSHQPGSHTHLTCTITLAFLHHEGKTSCYTCFSLFQSQLKNVCRCDSETSMAHGLKSTATCHVSIVVSALADSESSFLMLIVLEKDKCWLRGVTRKKQAVNVSDSQVMKSNFYHWRWYVRREKKPVHQTVWTNSMSNGGVLYVDVSVWLTVRNLTGCEVTASSASVTQ